MPRDYYADLGLERKASVEEIKSAFRRQARDSHPDANPGDAGAEARFRRCLLYTSPSPRDRTRSRMPSSA